MALGAMAARGFHNVNNNMHFAPRNNNAWDNNWSYKHYYNPGYVVSDDDDDDDDDGDDNDDDDASSDTNNTNSVVVNPVVVNPVIVDKNNNTNPVNTTPDTNSNAVKIYQYTDEQGVTHFSDLPFKNQR